jgi:hypothetical protein
MLRNAQTLVLLAGLLAAACAAPAQNDYLSGNEDSAEDDGDEKEGAIVKSGTSSTGSSSTTKTTGTSTDSQPSTDTGTGSNATPAPMPTGSGTGTTTTPPAPTGLPFQVPTEKVNISSPSKLFDSKGSYKGGSALARANDKHASSVTGKDCMSCHGTAGPGPQFAFGGSIKKGEDWDWFWGWPNKREDGAKEVEIRVIGEDGYVFDTISDKDGNFFYKSQTSLKPKFTGVRKDKFARSFKSNGAACNSCHENGKKTDPGKMWIWEGSSPGGWGPGGGPYSGGGFGMW